MARNLHVRLLVHAGAPSSNHDDVHYRIQASAYAALEQPTWRRVESKTPPIGLQHPVALHPASDQTTESPCPQPTSSYIEDTQLAYAALDTQFFPLSTHKTKTKQSRHSSTENRECSSAPGTSCDSAQRKHHDEKQLVTCDGDKSTDTRTGSAFAANLPDKSPHERQDGIDSNDDTTSQLPSSFSLTESDRFGSAAQTSAAAVMKDPDPCSSPLNGSPANEVQESNDPVTETTSLRPPPVQDEHGSGDVSSTIRAPSPPVSMNAINTHITPTLQHLATESPAAGRYNPISIFRVIEPNERGHWLIDCETWQRSTQIDFWKALEVLIANGSAGWGIWAHRGAEVDLDDSHAPQPQIPQSSFGPIKVYCWGEVVEHTYLLLYVASNSRVRRQGLQWIDSEGHVVVQMRAAGSSSDSVIRAG